MRTLLCPQPACASYYSILGLVPLSIVLAFVLFHLAIIVVMVVLVHLATVLSILQYSRACTSCYSACACAFPSCYSTNGCACASCYSDSVFYSLCLLLQYSIFYSILGIVPLLQCLRLCFSILL